MKGLTSAERPLIQAALQAIRQCEGVTSPAEKFIRDALAVYSAAGTLTPRDIAALAGDYGQDAAALRRTFKRNAWLTEER